MAGISVAQIFTSNQRQWKGRRIGPEEAALFREMADVVFLSHASYLINPAGSRSEIREKSSRALREELARMKALGIRLMVIHPGSHLGAGVDEGIKRAADMVASMLGQAPLGCRILLENTAGQGRSIGSTFEELARLAELVDSEDGIGFCIDTAHLFAAGYELSREKGLDRTVGEMGRVLGFDRIRALHVNDSKTGLGSRTDRHERIGRGRIGLRQLRAMFHRTELLHAAAIVETPGSDHDRLSDLRLLAVEEGLHAGRTVQ
jgi:deoxyribonuclease-4